MVDIQYVEMALFILSGSFAFVCGVKILRFFINAILP
jgi:hypothetical protein